MNKLAKEFTKEVKKLAHKYNMSFFFVTEGASACYNKGNDAVRTARESHMKWEKENGIDPYHDWDKES
jgi:hypothetical protein